MNKELIKNLLKDYEGCHSDFQIDNFIIGSQGDAWAQYKQCLREINGRVEILESKSGKAAAETEKELARFIFHALRLKKEIGELTEEKRYQLETKSWAAKGLKMAAIDIMASGRISNQTYDFLFALPKESMVDIIKKLSSKKPMELLGFEPEGIK